MAGPVFRGHLRHGTENHSAAPNKITKLSPDRKVFARNPCIQGYFLGYFVAAIKGSILAKFGSNREPDLLDLTEINKF